MGFCHVVMRRHTNSGDKKYLILFVDRLSIMVQKSASKSKLHAKIDRATWQTTHGTAE